ncbi:MAG: site-2 protease family protein [Phycisphaeraceae bacterium]|nr:site-2 protease family protein [Phycisphaeraceae bacterium]
MDALTTGGNLLLIILGFCLLIALHELGHFLAARWARIRVHAFAIGMGPVIFAYRPGLGMRLGSTEKLALARFGKPVHQMSDAELAEHRVGETEYSLRLLPIGGFVGMLGQDDMDPSARSDAPRSYQRASVGSRMVVVSAGVIANLLLAVVLFIVAFMVGVRFESPVMGILPEEGAMAQAVPIGGDAAQGRGLRPGDRVLSIDGSSVLTFADVRIAAAMSKPGQSLVVEVARPGVADPLRYLAEPRDDPRGGVRTLNVAPAFNRTITTDPRVASDVEKALDSTGLGASGLGPGWSLLSINDHPAQLGDDLVLAARASHGEPLRTQWLSPGGERQIEVTIETTPELIIGRADEGAGTAIPTRDSHLLGLVPLVEVAAIEKDHPNAALLKPGDVILAAGQVTGPSARSLVATVRERGAGLMPLRILRDGSVLNVDATIASAEFVGDRPPRLGITLASALDATLVAASALTGEPASDHAILPLSRIDRVNGVTVTTWGDVRREIDRALRNQAEGRGAVIAIDLLSPTADGARRSLELTLTPAQVSEVLALGWTPRFVLALFDPLDEVLTAGGNPIRAVGMGFRQTWRLVLLTYLTLDRLFRGTVAVKELHGPVGIVHIGSRVADRGFMYLIFFLAMISVNLAVLNFLPLPIVDGGLFLYLVYEKFRGRPPSIAFQNAAALLGLALIVGVFLIASYNDVMRLFGRG